MSASDTGAQDGLHTYADNIPLTLGAKEVEELAEIVNEARNLHPLRLSISADSLRGLKKVLDLGEAGLVERSSISRDTHFAKQKAERERHAHRGRSRPRAC